MSTYVICDSDGLILSIERSEMKMDETVVQSNVPDGGFFIDLTGQKPFESMDIVDIHLGYKADVKKKKLVKKE